MSKPVRSEGEPVDRLTRICAVMTDAFEGHPEHADDDRCIVFLDDGDRGGIVIHGYDDYTEALADLIMHLRAIFEANGKTLDLMFMGEDGIDRV
jgi:hypothetical protein